MSAQAHTISRPKVLFVDDEPRVLKSMKIMFRRDYDLHLAESGKDALAILSANDIDVIVSDHRMPQMTGVEFLSRARQISPRSIRILLTGYADLNAVEGSINEGEVFRFLTKPCAPNQLKETVRLAADLAAHSPVVPSAAVTDPSLFEPTDTAVIDRPEDLSQTVSPATTKQPVASAAKGPGILVFSSDPQIAELATAATGERTPVFVATNIARVVQTLKEQQPGVLLTDISENKVTIQTMTARLKQHLPELVTVVISEHRDILDMVWLINHGQIFRFLRKPLTKGRCAISLKAALQHHQKLLDNPELVKRHTVESTESTSVTQGVLSRLKFLRNLWSSA